MVFLDLWVSKAKNPKTEAEMLLENEDGTYSGGPLDVWLILHNATSGTFHVAFFEEHPLPGPIKPIEELEIVRLKSKMHHTEGTRTLQKSVEKLAEDRQKIKVDDKNVFRLLSGDEAESEMRRLHTNIFHQPIEWDGNIGISMVVPNWRKDYDPRTELEKVPDPSG